MSVSIQHNSKASFASILRANLASYAHAKAQAVYRRHRRITTQKLIAQMDKRTLEEIRLTELSPPLSRTNRLAEQLTAAAAINR